MMHLTHARKGLLSYEKNAVIIKAMLYSKANAAFRLVTMMWITRTSFDVLFERSVVGVLEMNYWLLIPVL
jgi:hypothetical protein